MFELLPIFLMMLKPIFLLWQFFDWVKKNYGSFPSDEFLQGRDVND
jgi:hypothetical protein